MLQARAEALEATGLVTDDNIDLVVASQRKDLELMQSNTDRRVADALKKQEADRLKKEKEKEDKKKKENDDDTPDYVKALRRESEERENSFRKQIEEMRAAEEKRQSELSELIKVLTEKNETLQQNYSALKDENEKAKAEKAKAERSAKIKAKALELGVPQWRIDEGIIIADDATDEAVAETLTKMANNIKTNLLPGRQAGGILGGDKELTKEEAADIAGRLVK